MKTRFSGTRTAAIISGQGLRARPLRTALAILSLLIGIVAVVCVWTASAIAERAVVARAELQSGRAGTYTLNVPHDPSALEIIRGSIAGQPAAAVTVPTTATLGADPALGLRLVGVAGDLRSIRPFQILHGRWIDSPYASSRAPHLVLNQRAASQVVAASFTPELRVSAINQPARPILIGVVDDGTEEATAYLRLDELLHLDPTLTSGKEATALFIGANSPTAVISQAKLAATGITTTAPTRTDQVESLRQSVDTIRAVFALIAGIALLVGALAVLNIGLATIGERVDELALRRAVGARPQLLAVTVLLESVAVGAAASVLALITAWPLLRPAAFALFPTLPQDAVIDFPWTAALAAASSGCLASVIGGLAPALRAARVPIARVMRA